MKTTEKTQLINNQKVRIFFAKFPIVLEKCEIQESPVIDLTLDSIQKMVERKIKRDLLRFRSCCTDPIASR